MADPIPFKRPKGRKQLRSDEAELIVREWSVDSGNVIIGRHAFDHIDERSIIAADVFKILRTRFVEGTPEKQKGEDWKVVVVKHMPGNKGGWCRDDYPKGKNGLFDVGSVIQGVT